jgi:hypothetical protein
MCPQKPRREEYWYRGVTKCDYRVLRRSVARSPDKRDEEQNTRCSLVSPKMRGGLFDSLILP